MQRGAGARWEAPRVPELASNDVSALARDGERLWIGTFDRGLAVLDGDRVARVRDPALDDKVNALAVERAAAGSRVWVATARGLDVIDPRAGDVRVTRFGEIDGLPSSDVHAVVALASGGALVGTGRGAAIVREGRVTVLGEKRGIAAGAVWAVAEGPRGTILLGRAGVCWWETRRAARCAIAALQRQTRRRLRRGRGSSSPWRRGISRTTGSRRSRSAGAPSTWARTTPGSPWSPSTATAPAPPRSSAAAT